MILFRIHSNFSILYPSFRHKIRPAIGKPLTGANDRRLLEEYKLQHLFVVGPGIAATIREDTKNQ